MKHSAAPPLQAATAPHDRLCGNSRAGRPGQAMATTAQQQQQGRPWPRRPGAAAGRPAQAMAITDQAQPSSPEAVSKTGKINRLAGIHHHAGCEPCEAELPTFPCRSPSLPLDSMQQMDSGCGPAGWQSVEKATSRNSVFQKTKTSRNSTAVAGGAVRLTPTKQCKGCVWIRKKW